MYFKNILRIFSASKRQKIKKIEPESEKQYSPKKECIRFNKEYEAGTHKSVF